MIQDDEQQTIEAANQIAAKLDEMARILKCPPELLQEFMMQWLDYLKQAPYRKGPSQ